MRALGIYIFSPYCPKAQLGVCQDASPGNGGLGTSSAAAQLKKYPQFTTTLHTQPFTDIGCSCAVSCWWLIPLASQYIIWCNLEASNTRSQLCSFLTHRQPSHTGLDAVFSYSSPSKGRNWKIFVQSSPRWLGVCFFLWDLRLHASPLLGQQDSSFVDGCGAPAMDFLQPQPALLSPHLPVTGFVMKTHLLLEKMLFGHRRSQRRRQCPRASPARDGQRQVQCLKWDINTPFQALPLVFSLHTT